MKACQKSKRRTIFGLVGAILSTVTIFHYSFIYINGDLFTLKQESSNESLGQYSPAHPGHAPSCFRQVQIWKEDSPKKPQDYECPGLDCGIRFVEDTSFETMKTSDAVVLFHKTRWDWDVMQMRRPANQAWVFYSLECPRHTGRSAVPPKDSPHIYNYTMTYRPSSSIHSPYGLYDTQRPQVPLGDNRNWAEGKTGKVVWMASNCHKSSWKRYEFVIKLSNYIKVDIYGACGNLQCDRGVDECWDRISTYKFYLAIENNECSDYITEKFWKNALMHDVVPIVYGPKKIDYLKIAPPNSFIHLEDFKSFDELSDYLHLLDSNDMLYNSFFEWKRHGSARYKGKGTALSPHFLCRLVAKIRKRENDVLNGKQDAGDMIPSIHEWWSPSCRKASGFPHDF